VAAENEVGSVQKKVVLFASLLLFILFSATAYLGISNLRLKEFLKKGLRTKITRQGADLQKHKKIKEGLKRGLEEKYRADMISSRVAAKRLKQEQARQGETKAGQEQKARQ
jgi:hypothetical protein